MPSSKKPRKKYHPKPVSIGYNVNEIEHVKELWQRIELGAYISLPNGTATIDDLLCLRDLFNVVHVSCAVRKDFPPEKAQPLADLIVAAGTANTNIINRGAAKMHFVAKGDELKLINEALSICGPYIKESLEVCPRTFLREWMTSKEISKNSGTYSRMKTIPISTVKRIYERF